MKGLIITTSGIIRTKDFTAPAYKSVGEAVGGYIEIVRPKRLNPPYCMVVNEEGLLHNLPLNLYGSYLYGTDLHGNPIAGDIVILKEEWGNDGIDLAGLPDEECTIFADQIEAWSSGRIHREVS